MSAPRQPRQPRPRRVVGDFEVRAAPKPKPPKAPKPVKAPKQPKAERPTPAEKLSPEVLQLALDQAIRDMGLPEPKPEYVFAKDIKRRWAIDRAWVEQKIALEIEGGIYMRGRHIRPKGFLADMDKYNELALRGWLLVRISYEMIKDGRALALISRAHTTTRSAA